VRDRLMYWWRELKSEHLRPRAERAVGFAIGLFYPRVVPRLAMLDFCVTRSFEVSPMKMPQASIRLYCLDTKEAVALTVHGDQVDRLCAFVRKAYGRIDDHSS
jgi:hypothetical protein